MTVGELREELEGYGAHLLVELYDDSVDMVYTEIDEIIPSTAEDGSPRVTIAFSHNYEEAE